MRTVVSMLGLRRYVWTTDFDGTVRIARAKRGGPTGWMCKKIWGWVAMLPDHSFELGAYTQNWTPFRKEDVFDGWRVDLCSSRKEAEK